MKLIVAVLVLCLSAAPLLADNLLAEIDDVVIRRVETSCLIGNVGAAVGAYWPMVTIAQFNTTIGPMGALGHEAIIAGVGVQVPVDITIMGLAVPVDFGFFGGFRDWVAKETGFAAGVGKTFDMEF